MKILITGATGKVGTHLIAHLQSHPELRHASIRALCHNRTIEGLEIVRGSIADRACARAAIEGVSHVVHLATCKETPDDVMDVAVKGLFWLLDEFRQSGTAKQFILIGGDAAVGHFFYDHGAPVTEKTPHMAYPGCYALSKVLEEVMLSQFVIQYGINACCLRAPWIMEKDDFKYSMSFGPDVFGGPRWCDLVGPERAAEYVRDMAIPLLLDANDQPLKRNFIHVDDLVSAIGLALGNQSISGKLLNVGMETPVDYGEVAGYLKTSREIPSVAVKSSYHSNWMDISAARFALNWRPKIGMKELVDKSWDYVRPTDDPRKIWYQG